MSSVDLLTCQLTENKFLTILLLLDAVALSSIIDMS